MHTHENKSYSCPMIELGPEADAARQALEQILKSPGFVRNERLSRFLRFLVERHLDGHDDELKESVIGTEVFGRKPGYDPKRDPVVRTEARRLRQRLTQYYEGDGANDAVMIELPKGGYVPVVHVTEGQPATLRPPRFGMRRWAMVAGMGLAVVLGIVAFTRFSRPQPTTTSPVNDLYVRAREFEAQSNLRGVESSIDLFKQALIQDPSFAPAYAGIAAGYAARSGFDAFDTAQRADMIAHGWAAAEKALRLDPRSADAYDGMAMMQARQAQWEPAERSFRRAIELAPRDFLWRDHYAMFLLMPLGRVGEAVRQLRVAEEIEPLSPETHAALASALKAAGRFDEAFSHCQKAAPNDQLRSSCWADNLQLQGKNDEAVRILEAVWSGHLMEPGAQAIGIAYAKAGRRGDAERIAAILPRLASKAQVFAALGDKERTLGILDKMAPMGPARIGRDFLLSPNFAFLRDDPRLRILKQKVGLPN